MAGVSVDVICTCTFQTHSSHIFWDYKLVQSNIYPASLSRQTK